MQYQIIFIQILFSLTIAKQTNDQVRGCLKKMISTTCKNYYTQCFDDLICSNQFEDLFGNCIIKPGSQIYTNDCILNSYINISSPLLIGLFDCLAQECSIMEGTILEKVELEVKPCMQNALLDSSKCWINSKDCNKECLESLDVLQNCETLINENNKLKVRQCIEGAGIANQEGLQIAKCLMDECT